MSTTAPPAPPPHSPYPTPDREPGRVRRWLAPESGGAITSILTTILALPGSAHNRSCNRSILGLVLSVLLLHILIQPVIGLLMLTTACPGNRRTGYCAGSGTTRAPARLRTSGAGAAGGAGLSLAGADVLLDGFGRLACAISESSSLKPSKVRMAMCMVVCLGDEPW